MTRKKELLFKLDGPGVTPETVDTLLLLQLAEASFRLMSKVANASKTGLKLRGLKVKDKCVAVAACANDESSMRRAVESTSQIVSGSEDPPRGAEVAVEHVRIHLRQLQPGYKAKFVAGKWSRNLNLPEVTEAERPWERTELRVRPVRVGGSTTAHALLVSDSEPLPFAVETSHASARRLGAALYQEIDVELEVCRDIDGHIARGRVIEVYAIAEEEPIGAWTAWFAANASEWNDIENTLEGLGRGD